MTLRRSLALALLFTLLLFSGCATADPNLQTRQAMLAEIKAEPPGDYFIARRYYKVDYKFWGYIRKPAKTGAPPAWSCSTNSRSSRPTATLGKIGSDNGYEYKFYGNFSGETVYEPASNGFYPEFILKGYELKNVSPAPIFKVQGALDPQRRVIAKPY
ncbi:MAG: hypothetical protein WDN28_14775 [Chthoniobacter sp.]